MDNVPSVRTPDQDQPAPRIRWASESTISPDQLVDYMVSSAAQEAAETGQLSRISHSEATQYFDHTLVAETNDQCVGFLQVVPGPTVGTTTSFWLKGFYVDPAFRGQKIGRQLWETACLEYADSILYCDTVNSAVVRLAEQFGFSSEVKIRGRWRLTWSMLQSEIKANWREIFSWLSTSQQEYHDLYRPPLTDDH